jgi:hypothetical protein
MMIPNSNSFSDGGTLGSSQMQKVIDQAVERLPDLPEQAIPPDEVTVSTTLRSGEKVGASMGAILKKAPTIRLFVDQALDAATVQEPDTPVHVKGTAVMDSLDNVNLAKTIVGSVNTVGDKANSATGVANTIAGNFGASAPVVGFIGQVTGIAGVIFSSLTAALDLRALISSKMKGDALKEAIREAIGKPNADPVLVKAIGKAMERKYTKAIKRGISFIAGVTATGINTGLLIAGGIGILALLGSNPVGWGIAIAILGLATAVGIGFGIYKLYRWIKKKNNGELSQERKDIAIVLYEALIKGDELAKTAITELGLPAQAMRDAHNVEEPDGELGKRQRKYGKVQCISSEMKKATKERDDYILMMSIPEITAIEKKELAKVITKKDKLIRTLSEKDAHKTGNYRRKYGELYRSSKTKKMIQEEKEIKLMIDMPEVTAFEKKELARQLENKSKLIRGLEEKDGKKREWKLRPKHHRKSIHKIMDTLKK